MKSEKLQAIGKDMGLGGAALQEWADAQRVIERYLRARAGDDQRVQMGLEEKRLQAEERVLQLRLKLHEAGGNERGSSQQTSNDVPVPATLYSRSRRKLLPLFRVARDDLDTYLHRFERVVESQDRPRDKWGLSLRLCLTGEALAGISRLDSTFASDYDELKATLLLRFHYTAEGYREKFRKARPEKKRKRSSIGRSRSRTFR
ncbi:hypothetical protein HPB51_001295 [Rhipicephalus microplus]|uniref:Uncharacterized protein n=1 Tax=Rhipicephalus microplus TaxID=6941 RepID=A0A9J6E5M5_RHIMP|nr:hypothetical protein HPB51_001295 [Rhipicephalus microplus]